MHLPAAVDVVVVGAGLTGASTALHLAERRPELSVLLLEAGHVAAGASGRGTGLLGPRCGPPIDVARRRDGDEAARNRFLASLAAVEHVIALARRHAPEAVVPVAGQLVVAATAAEAETLRRRARAYAVLGLPVTLAETDDPWAAATRQALVYGVAASVEPGPLTRALVEAAVVGGVVLRERTPVRSVRPSGTGDPAGPQLEVLTGAGPVRARAVVLAVDVTDGRGGGIDGLPTRGRQLVLQVSACATAPLPPGLLAELGGPDAPHVIGAAALGPYRRLTADGRLVLGGGPAVPVRGSSPAVLRAVARRAWDWQRRQLDVLHPALVEAPVVHRWSGRIGLTPDALPRVGRLSGGRLGPAAEVWRAEGWNGHGLAATVEAGRQLADRVLGGDPESSRPVRRWWLAARVASPLVAVALRQQTPPAPGPPVGSFRGVRAEPGVSGSRSPAPNRGGVPQMTETKSPQLTETESPQLTETESLR